MQVRDRHHVVEVEGRVRQSQAIALDREERVARDQVQALVDVGQPAGGRQAAKVALRLLDSDDVGVGPAYGPGDLPEVHLDASVPDVEGHHRQLALALGGASGGRESERQGGNGEQADGPAPGLCG